MIQVTYRCPQCEAMIRLRGVNDLRWTCPTCGMPLAGGREAASGDRLQRCLVCCGELFVRKDFPQRLGLAIVVAGFALSCVTWYYHQVVLTFGVLLATALVDVLLYRLMGDVLECYRCHAQYRGVAGLHGHAPFSLDTHEKHRQQLARIADSIDGPGATTNPGRSARTS